MSDYSDELDDIRKEAELQIELNKQVGQNHIDMSQQVIANMAALAELSPVNLELLKAAAGNPQ